MIVNVTFQWCEKYCNLPHLLGYSMAYDTARYPPRLWPRRTMESRPTFSLHCSMDSTNCCSASWASVEKSGLLLCPKPSRSRAYTGRSWDKASRFWAHRPTPPPNPWSRTMGVLPVTLSLLKFRVHRRLLLEMEICCFKKGLSTPEGTSQQKRINQISRMKRFSFLDDFGSSYIAASCPQQPLDDSVRWDTK